jgi:ribosome recycling factor
LEKREVFHRRVKNNRFYFPANIQVMKIFTIFALKYQNQKKMDTTAIKKDAEEKMQMTLEFLEETFSRIRAGRANAKILDGVRVDYYGTMSPLSSVATVTVPDAKTIMIQPWEKSMLKVVEKAIMDSDVGITPENNGEVIRLGIPPLTEERRKQLVKQTKQEAEDAKVSIRNARREGIDEAKKAVKNGMPEDMGKDLEADLQKIHDKYIKKVDELFVLKEKEILTV